jgi:polyferredoxin
MGIGFISILFLESYTHMAHSINKTVYLILSILLATIIADFVFEKSAWCRYICPMGGLGSLFSMSSIIEIRANKHTCTTICTTHDCFKGTEKVEPCPMFLHLQFLSDNRDCKVCLNCIKSCNHNATQMNIRIPGAEIASLKEPSLAGAVMSILLSGLLVAEIFSKLEVGHVHFLYIVSLSLVFALSLNLISNYFTASMSNAAAIEHFKHFGYTLLPLTLFGHIAFKFMEVFEDMKGTVNVLGIYKLHYNILSIIQLLLVTIGLFLTEYLVYKVVQNRIAKNKWIQMFTIQGTVPLIFAVLYLLLFVKGA